MPPFPSRFPLEEQAAERSSTNPPQILLIEDNEADVLLVRQALKENDVQATLTVLRDGEQGIQFIDAVEKGLRTCPDLVVLDLNLPKKSGHEVLARMRSTGVCANVPVVVLSSSAISTDTNESKRLGVVRHIQKPAELQEFMRIGGVLRSVLTGEIT